MMNIEEMKEHEWSISWSGGKDSTATIIRCIENGIPIKEILYVRMMYDEETPATLPVMTSFVDDAVNIFKSWGLNVRVVSSCKTAKELIDRCYRRSKYSDRVDKPYGVTAFCRGTCNFTSVKQRTLRSLGCSEYQMIGYASDEKERVVRLGGKMQSVLVALGDTEADCFEICRSYGLLSPLYELGFPRDGCWFCPNAGFYERKYLLDKHPELVTHIRNMIEMCDYDLTGLKYRNNWVKEFS